MGVRLQCFAILLLGLCLGASFASEAAAATSEGNSEAAPAEASSHDSNNTGVKTVYSETSMEPIADGMCPGLGAFDGSAENELKIRGFCF